MPNGMHFGSGSSSGGSSSGSSFGSNYGGSIVSGIFSYFGAKKADKRRAREAALNRAFQERMSSTAHQREVADLRAAGLNPILSATGGRGAASPGGSMARQEDRITPAISTALSVRRLKQEIRNMEAEEGVSIARQGLVGAQTEALGGAAAVGISARDVVETVRDKVTGTDLEFGGMKDQVIRDITLLINTAKSAKDSVAKVMSDIMHYLSTTRSQRKHGHVDVKRWKDLTKAERDKYNEYR